MKVFLYYLPVIIYGIIVLGLWRLIDDYVNKKHKEETK